MSRVTRKYLRGRSRHVWREWRRLFMRLQWQKSLICAGSNNIERTMMELEDGRKCRLRT